MIDIVTISMLTLLLNLIFISNSHVNALYLFLIKNMTTTKINYHGIYDALRQIFWYDVHFYFLVDESRSTKNNSSNCFEVLCI